MKLKKSDKLIFSSIFTIHLVAAVLYLYFNRPYFLTSRTYLITQTENRPNNIEKTLTVLINSSDFNKDLGLTKPLIQAADKTNSVIELKTSSRSKETAVKNFQTYEPKIISKLHNLNQQISIIPAASDIATQEVLPDYTKIILASLLSLVISLSFVYSISRYLR